MTYSSCDPPKSSMTWKGGLILAAILLAIVSGVSYYVFMAFAAGPFSIPTLGGQQMSPEVHRKPMVTQAIITRANKPCVASQETNWECRYQGAILF